MFTIFNFHTMFFFEEGRLAALTLALPSFERSLVYDPVVGLDDRRHLPVDGGNSSVLQIAVGCVVGIALLAGLMVGAKRKQGERSQPARVSGAKGGAHGVRPDLRPLETPAGGRSATTQ